MSSDFRRDLTALFSGPEAKRLTVLELGSYLGYCTRLLSDLFGQVIAVDVMPEFLQLNGQLNHDRNNIGICGMWSPHLVFLLFLLLPPPSSFLLH